jgi:hypothetical protein
MYDSTLYDGLLILTFVGGGLALVIGVSWHLGRWLLRRYAIARSARRRNRILAAHRRRRGRVESP